MLADLPDKIKVFLEENKSDLFLAALVFLVSIASFGLGRLSAIWPASESITIEEPGATGFAAAARPIEQLSPAPSPASITAPTGSRNFVASQKGSSYHLPNCPGAKQIKEENRVWFETVDAARAAGYRPAGNCPGVE